MGAKAGSKGRPRKPSDPSELSPPASPFRPNPTRSICVNGPIHQDLVYQLSPQIIRLQHESRDPITVYIDSPGGSVAHATEILRLLKAPACDCPHPCKLITVATTHAESAAALILTSGDYAIAFPESRLHFHGMRVSQDSPITVEAAAEIAKYLKARNEGVATSLSETRGRMFFFRFLTLRPEFAAYRQANHNVSSEMDCFVGTMRDRLTPLGQQVIQKAEDRDERYKRLSGRVLDSPRVRALVERLRTPPATGHLQRLEAEMLKAIITFELASNRRDSDWRFSRGGMDQVAEDFLILNEYIGQHKSDLIEEICDLFGDFILTDQHKIELKALPEIERRAKRVSILMPVLAPVWLFFGALCHILQAVENPLTATDAFWLGLIDEIPGANLPTLRKVVEQSPPLS